MADPRKDIPGPVKGLSLVSLFNDFASEMVYPVLPAFITGPLGGTALSLGTLDGAADLTTSLMRWLSGRLADRKGWAKPLIFAGYGAAILVRPLIAIASAAWQVIGFRVLDRIGKGLRSPARDAVIARITDPAARGRAFGFNRAADHLGAVLGSLIAWLMLQSSVGVREVIGWSALPGVIAIVVLLFALGGELVAPYNPTAPDAVSRLLPPLSESRRGFHLLGTDTLGRDVLSRLVYGITWSLFIALSATFVAMTIGTVLGIISGFSGGFTDSVIGRAIDLTLSFPSTMMLLALSGVAVAFMTGTLHVPAGDVANALYVILVLGFFGWPGIARIVRGQVLSIREREFVDAARLLGASRGRLYFKEILPNLWAPLLVYFTLMMPAFISFLSELVKASSLLSAIGVMEITYEASVLGSKTFAYVEFLTAAAILYFLIIFPLSLYARFAERRLHLRGAP